jgi:hypothetical protein
MTSRNRNRNSNRSPFPLRKQAVEHEDGVDKAVEAFEHWSQANLTAINNIVDAARGQQKKALELLTR